MIRSTLRGCPLLPPCVNRTLVKVPAAHRVAERCGALRIDRAPCSLHADSRRRDADKYMEHYRCESVLRDAPLPLRSLPGLQGAHPCCSTDHYGSFVFHTLFRNHSCIGPKDGIALVGALPQVAHVSLRASRL